MVLNRHSFCCDGNYHLLLEVVIQWLLVTCMIIRSTWTDLLQVISASFFVIDSNCVVVIITIYLQLVIVNVMITKFANWSQ